jgi:hypothetical protein
MFRRLADEKPNGIHQVSRAFRKAGERLRQAAASQPLIHRPLAEATGAPSISMNASLPEIQAQSGKALTIAQAQQL